MFHVRIIKKKSGKIKTTGRASCCGASFLDSIHPMEHTGDGWWSTPHTAVAIAEVFVDGKSTGKWSNGSTVYI